MLFFLRSWCYFSSSAVALLVSISKFKHIYEAELQLSTRFPFHCQDRFIFWFKWGSENEVEKSVEKVVPKGPKWTPQVVKNWQKRVLEGSQKETSKMDPLQDQEKWDFAIIYYTLARSEVSKKTHFWVPFWDRLGDKIVENRVPEQHQKKCWK